MPYKMLFKLVLLWTGAVTALMVGTAAVREQRAWDETRLDALRQHASEQTSYAAPAGGASEPVSRDDSVEKIRNQISRAARNRQFDLKELEKIGFSQAGTAGMSVPEGIFWRSRRIEADGTVRDTLYAVAPVRREDCAKSGMEVFEVAGRAVLGGPQPQGPAEAETGFPDIGTTACVHERDGGWYLFSNISSRVKAPGEAAWRPAQE